jgi:hypothetical protein
MYIVAPFVVMPSLMRATSTVGRHTPARIGWTLHCLGLGVERSFRSDGAAVSVAAMELGGTHLGSRLSARRAEAVVGRRRERQRLHALLGRGVGPAVVFVWGPGGIGKSMLVAGTVAELGQPVLMLGGRQMEPTPSGFLAALGVELGCPGPVRSTAQAGALLQSRGVAVLLVDGFERLNLLDGWLRNEFLVALPAELTTVLVGRRPPNLAWRTAPAWRHLLAELVLGPLNEADARLLVDRRGLPAAVSQRVLQFARGHPLALELAAEACARRPDLDLPDGPAAEVSEELFDVLLDDLTPTSGRPWRGLRCCAG